MSQGKLQQVTLYISEAGNLYVLFGTNIISLASTKYSSVQLGIILGPEPSVELTASDFLAIEHIYQELPFYPRLSVFAPVPAGAKGDPRAAVVFIEEVEKVKLGERPISALRSLFVYLYDIRNETQKTLLTTAINAIYGENADEILSQIGAISKQGV